MVQLIVYVVDFEGLGGLFYCEYDFDYVNDLLAPWE